MTGGEGSSCGSPDAVVWRYDSVFVRSKSRPIIIVSFWSLSRGKLGMEVSSKERLCQFSLAPSVTAPITPISDDVLSPRKSRVLYGSQFFRVTANEPGGRKPGNGRQGLLNLKYWAELALESRETWKCNCSVSGVSWPGAA